MNPSYATLDSIEAQLTERERSFLERQLRSTQRYAVFTAVDLLVAAGLTAWSLFDGLGGTRFALIVLVLLHARANLKQHKDALLMAKLQRLSESNAREPGDTVIDYEFVQEAKQQFEKPAGGPG